MQNSSVSSSSSLNTRTGLSGKVSGNQPRHINFIASICEPGGLIDGNQYQ